MYTCMVDTPIGAMLAAAGNPEEGCSGGEINLFAASTNSGPMDTRRMAAGLCGLWFIGQKYFPSHTEAWEEAPDQSVFLLLKAWLMDYFSGKKPLTAVPLTPAGTDFQRAVWKLLVDIPCGETSSYGAIAARLAETGRKASAQAVGGAVGHNPISILIPCHRVVGADGSLTGYAGGLDRKRALLELEKAL